MRRLTVFGLVLSRVRFAQTNIRPSGTFFRIDMRNFRIFTVFFFFCFLSYYYSDTRNRASSDFASNVTVFAFPLYIEPLNRKKPYRFRNFLLSNRIRVRDYRRGFSVKM